MNCEACGSEIAPNDRFCAECGKSVVAADAQQSGQPAPDPLSADTPVATPAIEKSYVTGSEVTIQTTTAPSGASPGSGSKADVGGVNIGGSFIKDSTVNVTQEVDQSVHNTEEYITNVTYEETMSDRLLTYRQAFFDLIEQYGPDDARSNRATLAALAAELELPEVARLEQERLALTDHEVMIEAKRSAKSYQLRVGDQPKLGVPVSIDDIVNMVNRKGIVDTAVDVSSGDDNWVSVWTLPVFLTHPGLSATCSFTGKPLVPRALRICPQCGIAFHSTTPGATDDACPNCLLAIERYRQRLEEEHADIAVRRSDRAAKREALSPDSGWKPVSAGSIVVPNTGRTVAVDRPLMVLRAPVTEGLYESVVGGGRTKGRFDYPVSGVSWEDAIGFCNKYSTQLGIKSLAYTVVQSEGLAQITWDREAEGIRLLTELEWEWACRAGSSGRFSRLEDGTEINEENLEDHAVFADIELPMVMELAPNFYGLFDMLGCVREWVWDQSGDQKLTCGGSYADEIEGCTCTSRVDAVRTYKSKLVGMRIATYGEYAQ